MSMGTLYSVHLCTLNDPARYLVERATRREAADDDDDAGDEAKHDHRQGNDHRNPEIHLLGKISI